MKRKPQSETKVWCVPELGNLELLHAKYINHSFDRHSHETYAIGVIEEGALGFYYRGENVVAPQGSINLCIPGEVHNGHSAIEHGWQYRMFYLDPQWLQAIACDLANHPADLPFFQPGTLQDPQLAHHLRQLHIQFETQSVLSLEQETWMMWTLGQMIIRYADAPPRVPKVGHEHAAVQRVKHYLEENHAEAISIDDLTKVAHLSRFHLVRVFCKQIGIPPHAYLRQVRLHKAKALLAVGLPIAEIAACTGFADQSHLTRWFKRLWGYTPGQYNNSVQLR